MVGKVVTLTLAVTSLVLSSAHAGEIKTHQWPFQFAAPPLEIAAVPVVMDIGSWVSIKGTPQISLRETSPGVCTGCTTLLVRCNADVRLSATITPTGAVKGDYSCSMLNWDLSAPGGITVVCAKVENPEIAPPGRVRVATIKVSVSLR